MKRCKKCFKWGGDETVKCEFCGGEMEEYIAPVFTPEEHEEKKKGLFGLFGKKATK